MSDENIQILRRAICAGCLSQDRKLYPVKNLKQYALFCYAVALDEKDWVCWECRHMVAKLAVFRGRVVRAQAVLADLLSGRPCQIKSLSQLSTITITDNADDASVVEKAASSDPVYYQLVKEAVQSDDTDDEVTREEVIFGDSNDNATIEVTYADHTYEALMDDDVRSLSHDDGAVTNITFSNIFDSTKTPKPRFKTQAIKKNSLNIIKIIETDDTESKVNETQIKDMELENPRANSIEVENPLAVNSLEGGDPMEVNTLEVEVPIEVNTIEVVDPFTEEVMSEVEMTLWRVRKRNLDFFADCPPLLRCEECIEPFDNQRLYTGHMKGHTKAYGELTCPICELRFHEEDEVKAHKTRHYRLLKCKHCPFEWDSRNGMRRHCVDAHGVPVNAWSCDHCYREYPNARKFGEHRDCHRAKQCPECGILLRSYVKKHMMRVHKDLPMIACETCGLECKGNSGLKQHKLTCFKVLEETYCAQCNQSFNSKYSYRVHMRNSLKHAAEKRLRFQCSECGKGFLDTISLTHHTDAVHDRRKKYACEQCGECFHTMIARRRHARRAHEGKRPAKDKVCDYCGKAYALRHLLLQHMNKHTGARPYKCQCGASFAFRTGLKAHARLKHGARNSLAEATAPA